MSDFSVSVLFVTYNSELNKIFQTLASIINQKKVDLKVVVSDDGSENNHYKEIEDFFISNNFSNYFFAPSGVNLGTVKNILKGAAFCTDEFFTTLSPGDFFYNENSLYDAMLYISNNKYPLYFGRNVYYSFDGKTTNVIEGKCNPHKLGPYLKYNYKKIKENYFIDLDFISGSSIIAKTDVFIKYLNEISSYVKFAEDYSIIPMLANGEIVAPLLQTDGNILPFVWYECNTGISTTSESKWKKILVEECRCVFEQLVKENKISSKIYKMHYDESLSRFKRTMLLFVLCPRLFFTRLIGKVFPPKDKCCVVNDAYLNQTLGLQKK